MSKLKSLLHPSLLLAGILTSACALAADNDVEIYANGHILTMNSARSVVSAMAIKDGRILAVGELDTVKRSAGEDYEYYDLEGHTVTSGFIEGHDHMALHGATLELPDVTPFTQPTLKGALEALKKVKPDADGWVRAWAIDPTLF